MASLDLKRAVFTDAHGGRVGIDSQTDINMQLPVKQDQLAKCLTLGNSRQAEADQTVTSAPPGSSLNVVAGLCVTWLAQCRQSAAQYSKPEFA